MIRYKSSKFDWINGVGHAISRELADYPANGIAHRMPESFEVESMVTGKILSFTPAKIEEDHVEYIDAVNGKISIKLFR